MASPRLSSVSINATTDGDNTLVAGVSGKVIRVWGGVFNIATNPGLSILKSGASGTEHGRLDLLKETAVVMPVGEEPYFECDKGASLFCNNAAGIDLLGFVSYTID